MKTKHLSEMPNKDQLKPLKHPLRLLDVKSDVVFKKIFGQNLNLVKSFLNSVLPLPEDNLIDTISYLSPEQSPRIPSFKNTIVDVKCTDQHGRIFIVEMQLAWTASFMKRFLFGASKAFVQQLESGKSYDALCPVYGLAILNESFDTTSVDWYHHYKLTNVKDLDKSLEGLELIFVELLKFQPQTFTHKKMGILWLRFLREINEELVKIPPEFQDNPDLAMALELAQESFYSRAELYEYDEYLDAIRTEKTIRADSKVEGERIGLEKGEKIGLEKGEKLGLKKGEQIGRSAARQELAQQLIKKGMSIHEITELTGFSTAELNKLKG